jgi:hypothetical protein
MPTGHLARCCLAQGSGMSLWQTDFDLAQAAQAVMETEFERGVA